MSVDTEEWCIHFTRFDFTPFRMNFSLNKVRWLNSAFLIGTFVTTCTAVPYYIWQHGVDAFQAWLFFFFFMSTGLSITLGYHRLFSHLTFNAKWPVKLYTLLFGAAAFEGSALGWCADHRRHHKHVDHDEDPYDISKGFFHAHIGWLLFRTGPDTAADVACVTSRRTRWRGGSISIIR